MYVSSEVHLPSTLAGEIENGFIKFLEGRENEMKMTEKVQCGRLKKVEDDDSDSVAEENEDDFEKINSIQQYIASPTVPTQLKHNTG